MGDLFWIVHEKNLSTKDLLTAIRESWKHFREEFCVVLVKFMSERIKVVIKAQL